MIMNHYYYYFKAVVFLTVGISVICPSNNQESYSVQPSTDLYYHYLYYLTGYLIIYIILLALYPIVLQGEGRE